LLIATLIIGVGIALWLARAIGRGLKATAQTAELIADGDLTRTVTVESRDEVGALGEAFNRMVLSLRELTGEVREGVQSLSAATSEIVASVTQQGASTSQQAAAVSETTATVDEVRVTAQQSSQKAQTVATMARHAAEIAAEGLGTVERSVAGMQDLRGRVETIADQMLALSEQTQQIGEIIASVEDLADQSNLLAVNATIEASRAGEQGRGFAAVAHEVRSLAERSKAATVQVRTLLTDIQRATNAAVLATEQGTRGADEGARLVEQAGITIRQLDETIRHSAEAAQQIAASVGQQGAGMDQIAVAMASINQSTLETDAGTRQLQKAAESLNVLAQRLSGLLGRYKLDRAA
jgi:methyl-accepting chemotaxis protein